MSRLSTHTHMHTHRERIDVSMYSLLPKKETALALTHTHPPTDTDMHTPPTSYYTDGHILGFTIGSPHHETTTACAHSRLGSTCCSRLDCNSTQCVTVCCVLCPVFCVLRVFSMLCAPPQVCCATRSLNAVAAGRSSDTSSRPVTVDALVYRCLVSSSSPPKRGTWHRPCTWRFPYADPGRGVFARGAGPLSAFCCPARCPRRRTPCHQSIQTQRHCSVVERLEPHPGPRDRRWNVMMGGGHGRYRRCPPSLWRLTAWCIKVLSP